MVLFTEIEFSFNARRASPLDFKNEDSPTKAVIISIPESNIDIETFACGTPSNKSKKVALSRLLSSSEVVFPNKI